MALSESSLAAISGQTLVDNSTRLLDNTLTTLNNVQERKKIEQDMYAKQLEIKEYMANAQLRDFQRERNVQRAKFEIAKGQQMDEMEFQRQKYQQQVDKYAGQRSLQEMMDDHWGNETAWHKNLNDGLEAGIFNKEYVDKYWDAWKGSEEDRYKFRKNMWMDYDAFWAMEEAQWDAYGSSSFKKPSLFNKQMESSLIRSGFKGEDIGFVTEGAGSLMQNLQEGVYGIRIPNATQGNVVRYMMKLWNEERDAFTQDDPTSHMLAPVADFTGKVLGFDPQYSTRPNIDALLTRTAQDAVQSQGAIFHAFDNDSAYESIDAPNDARLPHNQLNMNQHYWKQLKAQYPGVDDQTIVNMYNNEEGLEELREAGYID